MDRFLAIISIIGLLSFVGWINIRVMEPDLWIVSLVVMGIAIRFFWEDIKAGGSHFESRLDNKSDD
jgi:hypothetical protein